MKMKKLEVHRSLGGLVKKYSQHDMNNLLTYFQVWDNFSQHGLGATLYTPIEAGLSTWLYQK